MFFLWLYTIRDPLLVCIPSTFDPLVENSLCLTHRRVTIRSTQRSIEMNYAVSDWIGISRSSEFLVSDRFWKNGIGASLVIIQWDFCLTSAGAPQRSDLIIISLSGMTWRNRTNWDRLNPEELWHRLQDASRNLLQSSWETLLKCTEGKSCFKHRGCSHHMLIEFS